MWDLNGFKGDEGINDIWSRSEQEVWMDKIELNELGGPWLSRVNVLYTDGDSDIPDPLESMEINEGGELLELSSKILPLPEPLDQN